MIQFSTQVDTMTSVRFVLLLINIQTFSLCSMPTSEVFNLSFWLLDDLDHPFPIIGLTETWLKPHNVDCFFHKWLLIYFPKYLKELCMID